MENYKERLERLLKETEGQRDLALRRAADRELAELLDKKGEFALSDALKGKASALYFRNRADSFLLNFVEKGCGGDRYYMMEEALAGLKKDCPAGFENTLKYLDAAQTMLTAIHTTTRNFAQSPSDDMSEEELSETLERLKALDLEFITDKFGYLKTGIDLFVQQKTESVGRALRALQEARYGEEYRRAVTDLNAFTGYEYFSNDQEERGTRETAEVAIGAFAEEAELYFASIGKTLRKSVKKVDLKKTAGASAGARAYLFDRLLESHATVAFFGYRNLTGEARSDAAARLKTFIERSERVFLYDDSPDKTVWTELKAAGVTDARYRFLPMPDYEESKSVLESAGYLTEPGDETLFRTLGVSIGFIGLNELMRAGKGGWRRTLKKRAAETQAAFRTFLERLPNPALLIDEGWRLIPTAEAEPKKERRAPYSFDYDKMRAYRPENLRNMIEGAFPLIAKCGMAVKYCLFVGEDDARWVALGATDAGRAEQEKRLENAARVLAALLDTEIRDPVVTVTPDAEWGEKDRAGGYLEGGGKRVVFREKCVADTGWILDGVLHEMFHSFQQTAIRNEYRSWWRDDLSVSRERIAEWTYNAGENRYFDINKNRTAYAVQVYEADARIFAAEAIAECTRHWSELKLI